jgi:hypothetical protein
MMLVTLRSRRLIKFGGILRRTLSCVEWRTRPFAAFAWGLRTGNFAAAFIPRNLRDTTLDCQ